MGVSDCAHALYKSLPVYISMVLNKTFLFCLTIKTSLMWDSFIKICEYITVDDREMGHVNKVGHLSETLLNLLETHKIGSVDTFESKQQNYDQT